MTFIDKGLLVSTALFFVFCGLFIKGVLDQGKLSDLGTTHTAPETLRHSAESLRISLKAEDNTKTVEDISETESWIELEDKLDDYALQLEFLREQQKSRMMLNNYLYVASAFSLLAFSLARAKARKKGNASKESPQGSEQIVEG